MAAATATTTPTSTATSARARTRATRARRADKTTARARRGDDAARDDGRAATARATARAACAAIAATAVQCSSARAYVPGFFAAAASEATTTTTTTTTFAGRYADPKHPGCAREIFADGTVRGEDGDPGCGKGSPTRPWTLSGVIAVGDDSIFIDFSPKGGPANLLGERVEEGVKFPDGNVWRKLD